MTDKILLVDDDTNILAAYSRRLRKRFEVWSATDGKGALGILDDDGPFAIVISDMYMPVMDGIEFLGEVKSRAPNTVRMMLTGNADLQTAIDAVNEGNIFRFCTKPCPPDTLEKAITAGLKQYQLVTAEQSLLQQTLAGSVKVLVDVLSLVAPEAFKKTKMLRDWAGQIAEDLDVRNTWELDLAAMLSPIGQITLPAEITAKMQEGAALTEVEWQMVHQAPEVAQKLIGNIPRLQAVGEIVRFQNKGFDGSGFPSNWVAGEDIPLGARILKILIDLLDADKGEVLDQAVFDTLENQKDLYDPEILTVVRSRFRSHWCRKSSAPAQPVVESLVLHLRPGDHLVSDIETVGGSLVLSAGHELSRAQTEKLRNLYKLKRLKQPVRVTRPTAETEDNRL